MFALDISYKKLALRVAVFFLIVVVLNVFIFHLTPFFLALLTALIINRPVNYLARYLPRTIAVLITLAVFLLIIFFILFLLVSNIISEIFSLMQFLPEYRGLISGEIETFIQQQEEFLEIFPEEGIAFFENIFEILYQRAEELLSRLVRTIVEIPGYLPGVIIAIIFYVISSFFITRDKERIFGAISRRLDISDTNKLKMVKDLSTYVKVQLIIIVHSTFWVGISLIVLDFPYAIILAIAAGVLELIPVLGPGGIIIPVSLISLLINPFHSLIYLVVYGVISFFRPFAEANFLARGIGVHPLILIFGLFSGLTFMGVQGIILAPMSIIIFKVLMEAEVGL